MLKFTYISDNGTVTFYGGGSYPFLIKDFKGLSLLERDYFTTTYAQVDGQETLYSRAMPRAITLSVDIMDKNAADLLRNSVKVLSKQGYLYITDKTFSRRIFCNQITIADPERVLRGKISSFVIQFVCDNPYFEDAEEIIKVIYGRDKNITTPFDLPRAFATTRNGAETTNYGDKDIEPIFIIRCNETVEKSGYISIKLTSSEEEAELVINDYKPEEGDVVTIDIKERTISGTISGNLINNLSDATFLSKFVLKPFSVTTYISASIENVTTDIKMECRYRNLYNEAVII